MKAEKLAREQRMKTSRWMVNRMEGGEENREQIGG
jgi:hypothetical protein